ncbi:autotransporter outer membrane beta-barrel domain-containing protein [Serratia rubidaea]|uniref:autotransporter outer membrane beta-barrel domain-containing protein n=1 Tax=Serratia rubidaea TaxID=61652 RepID=UPI0023AF1011|nr:autotransporter outer membrane beta-barrel domain-containing protein [Serratia rubidaea]MDK1702486.1 autotransporter outer membrane beta-barrel domain-containing protein [Serratia rubidaea]
MEKLWGHPSLPVKTRLSRLYVALAAALTLAGTVGAAYAENINVENGEKRIREVDGAGFGKVSGKGSEWRVSDVLSISAGLYVLDGGVMSIGRLDSTGSIVGTNRSTEIVVSGSGSHLQIESYPRIEILSLSDHGRFSSASDRLEIHGGLIIGSRGTLDGHAQDDEDVVEKGWDIFTLGEAQAPGILDPNIVVFFDRDTYLGGRWNSLIFNHTADDYQFVNSVRDDEGHASIANFAGNTTMSGDLSEFHGDIFVKGGKLTINSDVGRYKSDPPYQGLYVERGGTLILNGTIGGFGRGIGFTTSLFVDPGAVLGGDATIGRTIIEGGGHISPGDGSTGKFDINSYLTFKDGAFYDVDIAADGRSDTMAVVGQTTIGNNVKVLVNMLDPYTSYQDEQTYRILTSEKDIAGMFSEAVLDSAFLEATFKRGQQFIDLLIKQITPGGDVTLDGDRHVSQSVSYAGAVSMGQDKASEWLIDGGTFSAKKLIIGSERQSQAAVQVENGAKLVTERARIDYGLDDADYQHRPMATISGKGSEWQVNDWLSLAGKLDVLDGAQVKVGDLLASERPAEAKKSADIYVSGEGSHLHTRGTTDADVLALANGGRFSNDNKQLTPRSALVIGSRASFDGYSADGPYGREIWPLPTLGEAQAPGVIDRDIVITTPTDHRGMRGSIIFNHTSDDYQFANTIIGSGSMANVAGQTTLTGDLSQYGGRIFVKGGKLTIDGDVGTNVEESEKLQGLAVENGGTLLLNGNVGHIIEVSPGFTDFSTALFVGSGSVLRGNATTGRVSIGRGSHLSPGDPDNNAIGQFIIKSNLGFNEGAFYDVDIAADGRSDYVRSQGGAYIDKNVKVLVNTLDPHTSYRDGQTYRILTAGGGVNGMFSEAVLDSAFLDTELTRDHQNVDLTIRQKETGGGDDGHSGGGDDGNTGGGDDGHSGGGDDGHTGGGDDGHTGGGDDGHTGGGDDGDSGGKPDAPGIFQTVATSDNQWNTAGALSSLAQQGPSLGLYNALLMLNAAEARDAFNQLSGEQYASVQASLQQSGTLVGSVVNQHMQTMFDGDSLTVPPLAMSLVQSPERERNGAWGQMFGSWTRSKGDGNVGKLDSNTGGFLVGADRELSDGVRAGAYAGYSRTRFDVDSRASSGHSNNYHLGLYGAGQRDALALRGGVGYSWHRIESERNVGFGGYRDRLTGDYDGNTLQAFTELGYRLRYEAASVEPFVNLSYVRLHTDAVQEQGGAAALSVKDETMNTFYSTLGLRGATDIPVSGVDVTLHGKLGWQHAYGDTDTSARMAFASGDSFTSKGAPVDKDVAVVGVGLDVPLTRSTRVGVSYQGQYGSQQQANSVNAQLTVSF